MQKEHRTDTKKGPCKAVFSRPHDPAFIPDLTPGLIPDLIPAPIPGFAPVVSSESRILY